ncbi:LYR family protein [Trichophyton tonsurans CBS 112818]|uniref:NADH dehydrogenase [ubiquinone] 1 beta subcomplex subunit 9 n=1 Tax=Trichophyton tonsurans (strain CBS 112818) TaxID=647933 RepID=F2RT30_TRIT1|nr:LYR family protein [Trichophyton tonsurans CBS 112818]
MQRIATKSSQRVIEAIDHYRCSHGPPSSLVRPADIVVAGSREILTMGRVLYKRALKLSLDWAVHRNLWRGQAVYIRSLFEANKHVRNPHDQRVLLQETEKLLEKWKHPDPYRAPTAPGGEFSRLLLYCCCHC